MDKVRAWFGRIACVVFAAVLCLGCATAYAAGANSLSVRILSGGDPVPSLYVEVITVAVQGSDGYELDGAFAEGPRSMDELLGDSGAEAAEDLYQYAWATDLFGAVKKTNASGIAEFRDLPSGLYLVMERGDQAVAFSPYLIWLPQTTDAGEVHDVVTIPKTSDTDTRSIHVKKLWDDYDDLMGARPKSLEISLSRDGVVLQIVDLSAANLWQYTFRGLPNSGTYTISESSVEGYVLSDVSFDSDGNAVIVNEYAGVAGGDDFETVSIVVRKAWADDDDAEGKRPSSVTVQLIEDGVAVATAVLSASNNWSHVFTALDEAKNYTVKETAVEDYSASYSGDASTRILITNEYTPGATDPGTPPDPQTPVPELADIRVTKVWVDDDDAAGARPEDVAIYLISEGSIVEEAFIEADPDQEDGQEWTYVFEAKHPYRSYAVWERAVPDYTTTYSGNARDGFVVTNTYTPGTTDPGTPSDPSVPGEDPEDSEDTEDPGDPDEPGTGDNPDPEIPQTGHKPVPALILLAAGVLLILLGCFDLWRRRSEE